MVWAADRCFVGISMRRTMQRLIILGNAGSGKSTLARRIGAQLNLPVVHLDLLFWEPGWKEPDTGVFRGRVSTALVGDRWICEGNYAKKTFDLRLPRADAVIWLDTPRATCVRRVLMRSALNKSRPDLPSGCVEKLDADFLKFLHFTWNFDRDTRPGAAVDRSGWSQCAFISDAAAGLPLFFRPGSRPG